MKIVLAIGGNALLMRGEPHDAVTQLHNIDRAAAQIAGIASLLPAHELLITHGNGPQVGLLALQAELFSHTVNAQPAYPLDVLGAESQGQIGYMLEQALANRLPARAIATLMTRTEIDLDDPAFATPTKPIGPIYTAAEATKIAVLRGWAVAADGAGMRRVVASPAPLRILNLEAIELLMSNGVLVIAAGGGGVPVSLVQKSGPDLGHRLGVEAVIDKDATSSLLACALHADCLLIATDVPALYADFGQPSQRALTYTTPSELSHMQFAVGSMAPKVKAVCSFVNATGQRAVIGSLDEIEAMLRGNKGTQVCLSWPFKPQSYF